MSISSAALSSIGRDSHHDGERHGGDQCGDPD